MAVFAICGDLCNISQMQELMTVTDAAQEAGVTASTVYRWIQGGVLSIRYFPDGRQAIVREEFERLRNSGENAALTRLFAEVAHALSQVVALLPAVEPAFRQGWEGQVWPTSKWREVWQRALTQSEAHRDIAPFVRRRGRPAMRIPVGGAASRLQARQRSR